MASLTQTAIMTRKIIRFALYGMIFLIVGKIVLDISIGIYRKIFPPPPPPPTVSFGKLPVLPFAENQGLPELSITVETPDGKLPELPTQMKIYFMPKPLQTQLSLDEARKKAADLGFSPDGVQESEVTYSFPHKGVLSTFRTNIVSGAFSITYDLPADPGVLDRVPPAPEIAVSQVRSYLSQADLLPDDLTGPTKHEFLRAESGRFTTALALSDADVVKVNLFRKDYEEYPSLTLNPDEGNIWFMVGGAQERDKQMIAAEYHYFPLDEKKTSTYPIKTAQAALEDLAGKKGYVAKLGTNDSGKIVVRRIYLAYFDPGVPSDFFQPIVVFEGDNGFIAYVPAVVWDYYGE
jgi:hypothetical protein